MCRIERVKLSLLVGVVLLLAGLVSGCVVPVPEVPTPTIPTLSPVRVEQGEARVLVTEVPTPTIPTEEQTFFAADQVIVIGPEENVDPVIETVAGELSLTLERVDRLDLSYLDEVFATCETMPQFGTSDVGFVMDLYNVISQVAPVDVVNVVNTINTVGLASSVSSDPNYVTGDPYTGGGSAFPGTGGPAAAAAFWGQWAFGDKQGIGLIINGNRSVQNYTGQEVRIGIFDTVPTSYEISTTAYQTQITAITPTLTLTVSFPQQYGSPPPPPSPIDVSDHGLYVAGLVHAVAPESDIHLIRVLDEYAQGYLYTINAALNTFIQETVTDTNTLNGAVMNLSWGVRRPSDWEERNLPEEVQTLKTLLAASDCLGLEVVAAAGNDSDSSGAEPPQIPASFPEVLGVEGSNNDRIRACFSNNGEVISNPSDQDVAAPAGDALTSQGTCEPPPCIDGQACPDHLISLVTPSTSPSSYYYWSGTSFAAPLVSGLAALLLEANSGWGAPDAPGEIIGGACPSPDAVLANGIISLPHTFLGAACPP